MLQALNEANYWVEAMKNHGYSPTIKIYSLYMEFYSIHKLFNQMYTTYEQMGPNPPLEARTKMIFHQI